MKALIFAAGRGERMRPRTDAVPKPLLIVGGKPLIVWHIEKLAALGVRDIVINTSWLAGQFPFVLGDGDRWGVRLHYSFEGPEPLETGGGMRRALPLLGDVEPFLAVNGDIWTDFDFADLPREPRGLAHLVLVPNPAHHPRGDFVRLADGHARDRDDAGALHAAGATLTFAGIGVYDPRLIADERVGRSFGLPVPGRFQLAPLLRVAMGEDLVDAIAHDGAWTDVGTVERLTALDDELRVKG
jgi:MurNAc alpha-1-phosphate uridylyltransferase